MTQVLVKLAAIEADKANQEIYGHLLEMQEKLNDLIDLIGPATFQRPNISPSVPESCAVGILERCDLAVIRAGQANEWLKAIIGSHA